MRGPPKAVAVLGGILLLLLILTAVNSTRKGYLTWFIKVPNALILVNGIPVKGWLHSTREGRVMFFTRADADKPVTYDLVFTPSGEKYVAGCGTWVALRLPAIPVGDVNPACLFAGGHGGRNLNKKDRFVSFTADDGAELEAHW